MADPTPTLTDAEHALAVVLCSSDGSWNHPDRTADDPCSACIIVARAHLAAARADERKRTLIQAADALAAQPPKTHGDYVGTLYLYAAEPWRLAQPADTKAADR